MTDAGAGHNYSNLKYLIMKKLFTPPLMAMLFCCIGAFFITSCDDDDEKGPVNIAHPFQSVTAVDGSTTATAVISDDDKTITFPEFQELTDLSNVEVTFNLTPGAFLKTPAKPTARVNLTTAYTVEVNTGGYLPVAYTMTAKPKDIPNPILSAKVGDVEATMEGNIISIAYAAGMDINAMVFDFTLVAGASIKSPANKTFDLELDDGTLVVAYGGVDYTFVVRATGYTDPLLSNGWTDETANFGSLPKYIKVYKTTTLNGVDNNVGYIAIMGPKATMGVVGSGKTGAKPITELEQEGNWNVILVGVSTSATQTIVRDGKFVQDPEGINSFATIGQDKAGNYKMAWSQKFDGKLYAFPFRDGSAYTAKRRYCLGRTDSGFGYSDDSMERQCSDFGAGYLQRCIGWRLVCRQSGICACCCRSYGPRQGDCILRTAGQRQRRPFDARHGQSHERCRLCFGHDLRRLELAEHARQQAGDGREFESGHRQCGESYAVWFGI